MNAIINEATREILKSMHQKQRRFVIECKTCGVYFISHDKLMVHKYEVHSY